MRRKQIEKMADFFLNSQHAKPNTAPSHFVGKRKQCNRVGRRNGSHTIFCFSSTKYFKE